MRLLVLSYEEGVYDNLKSATDKNASTYKSVKKLINECGISEENAIWTVRIWRQVQIQFYPLENTLQKTNM